MSGWRLDEKGLTGVSYSIVDDGQLDIHERWAGLPSGAETDVRDVLSLLSSNSTARIGRLLAPYSIRYIVVPLLDGITSTTGHPLPAPRGLLETLTAQLDLRLWYTPSNYVVFENMAWIPTRAALSAAAAVASNEAGSTALASDDIGGSAPALVGMSDRGPASGVVPAGVVYSAVPFDARWHLSVDGADIAPRVAFGSTLAFDVPVAGNATLSYSTDVGRRIAVIVQLLAWLALLGAASTVRLGWLRRRRPLVDLDEGPVLRLGTLDGGAGSMFDPFAPIAPPSDEPVEHPGDEPTDVPTDVPAEQPVGAQVDQPVGGVAEASDPPAVDDVFGPGPFGPGPFQAIAPTPDTVDPAADETHRVEPS